MIDRGCEETRSRMHCEMSKRTLQLPTDLTCFTILTEDRDCFGSAPVICEQRKEATGPTSYHL